MREGAMEPNIVSSPAMETPNRIAAAPSMRIHVILIWIRKPGSKM